MSQFAISSVDDQYGVLQVPATLMSRVYRKIRSILSHNGEQVVTAGMHVF